MFRPATPTQRLVDALIAGGYVLAVVLVPAIGGFDFDPVLPALVFGAALAFRRSAPALALGLAWVAAVVQMVSGLGPDVIDTAVPPIVYACAAHGTRSVRWAAFTSALVGGGIAGVFTARSAFVSGVLSPSGLPYAVQVFGTVALLTSVLLLLAWTLGVLVRTAQQSRRNRQQAVEAGREAATEQERTRIARDMHDVVAHSLAVVIAQSDGARLLRRTDPAAVDEALDTIGATARAALADVRVLLQQLRYEGTTSVQPGLVDLPALVDRFRASGLDVSLQVHGDLERLGTATQLAAFRIVQESLTNALRHGDRSAPVAVLLARSPNGLSIDVTSRVDPARPPGRAEGHGLIGMRERASTVQGDLVAGVDGDRFRVRAFLPASATAAVPVVS